MWEILFWVMWVLFWFQWTLWWLTRRHNRSLYDANNQLLSLFKEYFQTRD